MAAANRSSAVDQQASKPAGAAQSSVTTIDAGSSNRDASTTANALASPSSTRTADQGAEIAWDDFGDDDPLDSSNNARDLDSKHRSSASDAKGIPGGDARTLLAEADRARAHNGPQSTEKLSSKPVSWLSLPRKDQLAILTLARLAEPLSQASLQAYMYFMLKSFDESLSDSEISYQAGILTGSFTIMQCLTAVWWGRIADEEWFGRKNVLLVGLSGTFFTTLGFGFSKSFVSAMIYRSLGGALNGNVGVMRTMISEIIKEKKFQTKAFLILPVTFNFGILIGPLLGGFLQNPVNLYPNIFGPGGTFGGKDGVGWMIKYPYAFPNVLNSILFLISFSLVFFGLEETHADRRARRRDRGIELGRWINRKLLRIFGLIPLHRYTSLGDRPTESVELSPQGPRDDGPKRATSPPRQRPQLPYRRIFTPNVLYTFLTHGLLHMHTSAFNNLWFLFLSTPRFDPSNPEPPSHTAQKLPFSFTGGLGLPPPTIGMAIGIIGFIGLILQFGIYPRVTHRLGLILTLRLALLLSFPLVYLLVPYLAVTPTASSTPLPADGTLIWVVICALLFVQVMGRTFVLPITQILVNNCTPHPSVLGSVHGIGQSVNSGCRTLGPVIWSYLYGRGLEFGVVGFAWWVLSIEALFTAFTSLFLREGTGHEIWLDGD